MRTIICILGIILYTLTLSAQNVNIPDTAFLNALIEMGIDTNEDDSISYTEASAIFKLELIENGITDMKGIEAFINLERLSCGSNQLTSLDLSNNTALTRLNCWNNQLTSLDLSNNTELIFFLVR